ncbi:MAG: M23 family metallopeptidase [Bacilli bacterium]|nr:M23 family metallopeptidase [Bacilli bacterium]
MKKRLKLRPFVFPVVYMILVLVLLGAVYYNGLINTSYLEEDLNNLKYVTNLDFSETIEVSKKEELMVRPYTNDKVKIGKTYYDYQENNEQQENSIIYYEGTYIQNSGVDYTLNETFDVVSCLKGTVISAEKTDLMGYVVEVRYNNDIIISYQSLSEVNVKAGDTLEQGQIIGKSGTSTIGKELGNHLHLEMYKDGTTVNPEDYYNKNIKDI